MGVKAVSKYQSSDGQLHDTIEEARKHDAMFTAFQGVKKALHGINPLGFGNLHLDLVNKPQNAIELRDALNKALDVQRRYGKLKKK